MAAARRDQTAPDEGDVSDGVYLGQLAQSVEQNDAVAVRGGGSYLGTQDEIQLPFLQQSDQFWNAFQPPGRQDESELRVARF